MISLLLASALAAAPVPVEEPRLPFERLRFVANAALFLEGEVWIDARLEPTERVATELRGCPEGLGTLPRGRRTVVLEASTKLTLQPRAHSLTWLDGTTLDVLQTLDHSEGRSVKLRRSTDDGLHEWVRRPEGKRERKGDDSLWSRRKEAHLPFEEAECRGLRRTGSQALIYQAAALRLDREGAVATLLARSRGRFLRVELEAADLDTIDVDYELSVQGRTERVKARVPVRRVLVSGEVLGEDDEEGSVGLLGLRSDIVLFLEPGSGRTLELRGKAPKLGELRVRLAEMVVPAPPARGEPPPAMAPGAPSAPAPRSR